MTRTELIEHIEKVVNNADLPLQVSQLTDECVTLIPDYDTIDNNESGLYIKYEIHDLLGEAVKAVSESTRLVLSLSNGNTAMVSELPFRWVRATLTESYQRRMLNDKYKKDIPLSSIGDRSIFGNGFDGYYHLRDTGRIEEYRQL